MIDSFLIISLISLLMFSSMFTTVKKTNDYKEHYFINDYLYHQSISLNKRDREEFKLGIYFNEKGHVNQARTLNINNKNITITLGNGRLHYE